MNLMENFGIDVRAMIFGHTLYVEEREFLDHVTSDLRFRRKKQRIKIFINCPKKFFLNFCGSCTLK
jgi:hypothetical protein